MRRVALVSLLFASSVGFADISYTVKILPAEKLLHVTMTLPNTMQGSRLQIPNWAPGSYVLADNYRFVQNLKAFDEKGAPLEIKTDMSVSPKTYGDEPNRKTVLNKICTWSVGAAKSTTVEYDLALRISDDAFHWSGPSTYIYELDRKNEKCQLTVQTPDGGPTFCGLDEVKGKKNVYSAPNYDVLADNPISAGKLIVDTYYSNGKPHYIVMRGAPSANVDRPYLIKACKFVSDMQCDLMRGAPYNKYIWHFAVNSAPDGAGGLEHLSSTQIQLAQGVGPRAVSVLSHEFFHLWNVKRIRSRVLGPFDYTKLPETGALWWLEGTTDYFAHYLLYKYGWWGEDTLFQDIAENVTSVRRNEAHKTVSPYMASARVGETNNGRGNSNGWGLSYYNQGWVVGMVLDIAMRAETNNKRTLNDVLLALWQQNKNDQPGFEEGEIRNQLVRFGGINMGKLYDRIVMGPGDMAVEETLAKAGLAIGEAPEKFADLGFSMTPTRQSLIVMPLAVSGPAEGKLSPTDELVEVNGIALTGQNFRELSGAVTKARNSIKIGDSFTVKFRREGTIRSETIVAKEGVRTRFRVYRLDTATPAQLAIREAWLKVNPKLLK